MLESKPSVVDLIDFIKNVVHSTSSVKFHNLKEQIL